MCKVKSGNLLKNRHDVQNLVIGIINRQQDAYSREKIYETVEYYFQGADVKMCQDAIRDVIDENLDLLYRKGLIDCQDGCYFQESF